MIYRKYGSTDKNISIISAGCMRFPRPDKIDEMALIPYEAAKHGINFFDTAPGYCDQKSEIILGKAVKEMKKSGYDYYISTKSGAMIYDDLLKDFEKSLKNLDVDHIDFMNSWYINKWDTFELREKNGVFKALYKLKEEGLISHVVCSTHLSGDEVKKLVDHDDLFEGIMLGFNAINFSHRMSGIKAAGKKKMGILTMNSLGGGIITDHEKKFDFIKLEKDESIIRSALRFILSFKEITSALLGFRSINDVNVAVKAIENLNLLDQDQIKKIKDNVINSINSLCTMCGYCRICNNNIPIPELMEAFNYLILYNNPLAVKSRLEIHWSIKDLNNILNKCEFCGNCELKCTQKLPILDRLHKLSSLGL